MEDNKIKPFYCYSRKLSYFIKSFGIDNIGYGINSNSKCKYEQFEKSERLDRIIQVYNEIKHKY